MSALRSRGTRSSLSRGRFEWETWDQVAAAFARQPSLNPVVVLDRSPAWARGAADVDNPLAPPHERRDFGAFARAVAERYRGRFVYYQVWDEPNIAPHWGASAADPAGYLGLLREAAVNIRAADPAARIVAAALAPTTESGGANLSDITYLDQLYSLGGREWFDYPAAQPYGFSQPPDSPADPSQLNFGRAALLRQVMLRHGDAGTPLWATAFGWDASASGTTAAMGNGERGGAGGLHSGGISRGPSASGRGLGRCCGRVISRCSRRPRPLSAGLLRRCRSWGLAATLRTPPRFAMPGGAPSHRPRTRAQTATPSISPSPGPGSRWKCREALTGLTSPPWSMARPPTGCHVTRPARVTWSCTIQLQAVRVIPLADGLTAGEHTVRLTAHGGWGQWPLRAVVITAAATPVSRLGLALLALAVLASLAAAIAVGRWRRGVAAACCSCNRGRPPSELTLGNPPSAASAATSEVSPRARRVTEVAGLDPGHRSVRAVPLVHLGACQPRASRASRPAVSRPPAPRTAPDRRQPALVAAHAAGPALAVRPVRGAGVARAARLGAVASSLPGWPAAARRRHESASAQTAASFAGMASCY